MIIRLPVIATRAQSTTIKRSPDAPPRYKLVKIGRTAPPGYRDFSPVVVSPDMRCTVGYAAKSKDQWRLFRRKQDPRHPGRYTFRAMTSDFQCEIEAVNNAGVIIGYISTRTKNGRYSKHTAVWEPEKTKSLIVPPTLLFPQDTSGRVVAIDNTGNIYGSRFENDTSFNRAFIRTAQGKITYLDDEVGRYSEVLAANDHRQAILVVTIDPLKPYNALPNIIHVKTVIWDRGTICELTAPPEEGKVVLSVQGYPFLAAAIGASGDIAGEWQINRATSHLLRWRNYKPQILNTAAYPDYNPLGIDRYGNIVVGGTRTAYYDADFFVCHNCKIYPVQSLIKGGIPKGRMLSFRKMLSSDLILVADNAVNEQYSYVLIPLSP